MTGEAVRTLVQHAHGDAAPRDEQDWTRPEGFKVLLAHDWILGWWGSERVVEQILRICPEADLVSAIVDPKVAAAQLPQTRVRELWVGKIPGARRLYQWLLPLEAVAFARVSTSEYDLVISSSHALAKTVSGGRTGTHICYCHSPPRYLWDQYHHYYRRSSGLRRLALRFARRPFRVLDRATARGVTHFVTNSKFVARRVELAYGRKSRVIHPPVARKDDGVFTSGRQREGFLLYLGRLVPYKRVDLIVAAARKHGIRTVIAGDGSELPHLQALAPPNVEFLGHVTDREAAELLDTCAAFVFCGEEDFGIAPVEANAHGAPVVALRAGGISESMCDGETAILFDHPSEDSLCDAVRRALGRSWDDDVLRANAARFSPERFRDEFANMISDVLDGASW